MLRSSLDETTRKTKQFFLEKRLRQLQGQQLELIKENQQRNNNFRGREEEQPPNFEKRKQ